jgi:hypothetical protein
MWFVTLTAAAFATCTTAVSSGDLEGTLAQADAQFIDFDEEGFKTTVVELAGFQLPCLGEVLPAESAAHYHRVIGIHRFILGDEQGSALAFKAAKQIAPEFEFDDAVFAGDHPVRVAYEAYDAEVKRRKTDVPVEGTLSFDGAFGQGRPAHLPTLTQMVDANGLATWSAYVGADSPLPDFRARPRRRNALLGCAGASAAVGAGLYGWSAASRESLKVSAKNQSVSATSLDGDRNLTNLLSVTGIGFLGAAAGCAGSAVIVGRR